MRLPTPFPAWLAAVLAAALGCLATAAGLGLLATARHRQAARQQELRMAASASAVSAALQRDEALLLQARAFALRTQPMTPAAWRDFVASLDLPGGHPGLKSMAYLVPVPRDGTAAYLAAQRRLGTAFQLHDHFTPWPGDPLPGPPAPDLFVIQDLEPAATNQGGLGLDAGANPVQRRAAERARDTGLAALTGRLTFGDLTARDPALGFYLPVYQGGKVPAHLAERRRRLVGWVSLGLWARPLLLGALRAAGVEGQDGLEVVDLGLEGPVAAPATVLYGEGGALGATWRAVRLEIGGRVWELRFREAAVLGLRASMALWGAAGLALSLALGAWVGARARARRGEGSAQP